MTIYDLVFLAVFLTAVIAIVGVIVAAIRGQRRRALGGLRALGMFLTGYLVIVVVVSLTSPQRVLRLNEPQCWDDWCISVDRVEQTPADAGIAYVVSLRLFSRARGRTQRENGVSVYLLDDRGGRYEPQYDPQAVPFNVALAPGEAVTARRRFTVPADVFHPGLVVAHGRFPGMFIIADGQSLLHKPSVVRFP